MNIEELHSIPIMIADWETVTTIDKNHIQLNNVTMLGAIDKKNVEIKAVSLEIEIK